MLCGLVLLLGATAVLCLSNGIPMLMVGRALQGLSASITWTVGLALVVDTVDRQRLGYAMGYVGMATSLGILVAPLAGGVVYNRGGYYEVFAMCFGLLAVDIVLRLAIIEVKDANKWLAAAESRDANEQVSGSNEADKSRPAVPDATSTAGTASARPEMTPRRLFEYLRRPRLLAALWGTLVHSIIQTSFDSTLPLLVEDLFGWDSIGAGLVFLPLVVPSFLSPLVGILGDRYGPKWLATGGFLLATPFLVCLRFVEDDNMGHRVMLCGLLAGIGIAIALVFGPTMAEISWSLEDDDPDSPAAPYALAYGLYNMAFSGGAMLGPIMGGLIRDNYGWSTVGWSLGLLTFLTSITQALWIGKPLVGKAQ